MARWGSRMDWLPWRSKWRLEVCTWQSFRHKPLNLHSPESCHIFSKLLGPALARGYHGWDGGSAGLSPEFLQGPHSEMVFRPTLLVRTCCIFFSLTFEICFWRTGHVLSKVA